MEDKERGVRLEVDQKVHQTITKPASLNWPLAVDRRLDQLVELANDAGALTRRAELAAAVLAAIDTEPEALLQLVLRYRRARVREIVIDVQQEADVVYLPTYGPGRRRTYPTS